MSAPIPFAMLATLEGDNLVLVVGGSVAVIAILSGCIKSVVKSTARERSRREIAAYIAEGSMTPEQGERLINAGESKERC